MNDDRDDATRAAHLAAAIVKCELQLLGWRSMGGGRFEKSGKIYDLSASNLEMLDYIEEHGCSVVGMAFMGDPVWG